MINKLFPVVLIGSAMILASSAFAADTTAANEASINTTQPQQLMQPEKTPDAEKVLAELKKQQKADTSEKTTQ